jgi:flagellar protein FlaG
MTTISSNTGLPPPKLPEQRQVPSVTKESTPGAGAPAPAVPSNPVSKASPAAQPNKLQPSSEELKRITEALQRRIDPVAPELQFSVDQDTGRSIIKITDRTTNEVIRQIPSEEALQINKGLDRFEKGFLLDRKA